MGAGASHDYIVEGDCTKNERFRPPLVDDIFNSRKFENPYINKYQEIIRLSADVATWVPQRGSFEKYLSRIKLRAGKNEERQKQLVALSFYLQFLFFDISLNFGHQAKNNYHALVQKIKDNGGEACIVDFNYDILLEQSLNEYIDNKIESYIQNKIKVIKLHGSCDWTFLLNTPFSESNSYNYLMTNPWYETLPPNNKPNLYPLRRANPNKPYYETNGAMAVCMYPAVAIPLGGKDNYICPQSHVDVLRRELKIADKLLIIGWRGGDPNLIRILEEEIEDPIQAVIVSGSKEGASEVAENMESIKNLNLSVSLHQGFSNFMKSGAADDFLEN